MDSEPQEPHLGCKPGDGVRWSAFRPLVVHKVRFATRTGASLYRQVRIVVKLDVEE